MVQLQFNVSQQIGVICSNCGTSLSCNYRKQVIQVQICECRNSVIQDLKDHNDYLQDELASLREFANESNINSLADSLDKALNRISMLEAELDLYQK